VSVDETATNLTIGQLKSEMSFLAEEIGSIGLDAMDQPAKYGPAALKELRHSHMGEILRLRSELEGLEKALLALKINL
jgi:hypothetical protein